MFSKLRGIAIVSMCVFTCSVSIASAQLLQFENENILGGSVVIGTTTVTFDVPTPTDSVSAEERLQRLLFFLRSGTDALRVGTQAYTALPRELLDITFGSIEGADEQVSQEGAITPSTSAPECVPFDANFALGAEHPEVVRIQAFLNRDVRTRIAETGAGSPGEETTYYGAGTRAAVSAFQSLYRDAILTPVGLSEPTGYWGARTREYANQLSGCVGAQ